MNIALVKSLSAAVPRYTSYPTAPNFSARVGAADYASSLTALPGDAKLSLYVHIPFCHELCWYCGCNTKATRREEPVAAYVDVLLAEIARVAALWPTRRRVSHVHFGGGSPNLLTPRQIIAIAKVLKDLFAFEDDAEFAVEIDPRWLTEDQVTAFAAAGVNRASIGVQDFNPEVQKAINRMQSFAVTEAAIGKLRNAGIKAVNIDLVYGLPHQTRVSVAATMQQVLTLKPDRIALFGYAHLPERLRHQRLIDSNVLPDAVERFGQSQRARRVLQAAGYVAVGLDHFAEPDDTMAQNEIRRNFQGYTTDQASALVGFGASAISQLPGGYFQNAVSRADYERLIGSASLATVRGCLLSADDRVRGYVIERLMCDFSFSRDRLIERFGAAALPVIDDAEAIVDADQDGFVEATADGFRVTPLGRPFVRTVAACFDAYLDNNQTTKFSVAV